MPKNTTKITELEALQNHLNYIRFEGLELHEKIHLKRWEVKKYYLSNGYDSISPFLNYDQMNHFLLGFNKALKLKAHKS